MSEYSGAIDYFVDRSRVFVNQNTHRALVVHGTGGSASQSVEQLGEWFRTNPALVSSHYGVGRDGRIAQYVREQDGAAANCCLEPGYDPFWDQFGDDNLNVHTISIEHVNDVSNSLPLTDVQKAASFKLIASLCNKYHLTFDQVKTHASLAPGSRARCPGSAFPLDELKAYLNGGSMQLYGPGHGDFDNWFSVTGDNWICKQTGCVLLGGNRDLYSRASLDGNTLPIVGLPCTNELYQTDESDGYSWSVQFFERGVIAYDREHRKDSQPGLGASYFGKYLQFQRYDPRATTVEIVPDIIKTDIDQLITIIAKLREDAKMEMPSEGNNANRPTKYS